METISFSTNAAAERRTINGREFLVTRATLIVPGVLNGSKGALYYPSDEIAKDPMAWNGMPIVGYHPQVNGIHVSGRDPDIFADQGLGYVYRAQAGDTLNAELWFDVQATRNFDKKLDTASKILPRLESGKSIEISTGLFTDNEDSPGTYNDRNYDAIARNYRPDHLAVLPDQIGACSVADGCGINVNFTVENLGKYLNPQHTKTGKFLEHGAGTGHGEVHDAAVKGGAHKCPDCGSEMLNGNCPKCNPIQDQTMNRQQVIGDLTANCDCWKGKEKVLGNAELFTDEDLSKLKANLDQLRALKVTANAFKLVTQELGVPKNMNIVNVPRAVRKVKQLVANAMEMSKDDKGHGCDGEADDPECKAMFAAMSGNAMEMSKDDKGHGCDGEADDPECKAMFAKMSGNAMEMSKDDKGHGCDGEADDPECKAMFAAMSGNAFGNKKVVAEEPDEDDEEYVDNRKKGTSMDRLLANATPQDRAVWNAAKKAMLREKIAVIQRLVANVDPDQRQAIAMKLLKKSPKQLNLMLQLVPVHNAEPEFVLPNFGGAAGGQQFVANHQGVEVLEL